jgi:Mn2+/Fe2+ NRAMP family transporter
MRKFFGILFAILLGLILVAFATANRHVVRVSLDPFNPEDPWLWIQPRLFELMIAVAILGVIAGGCATWFGQRRWRRAARQHEADARSAKAQLAELRSQVLAQRGETQRLALPARAGFFVAPGRDKQGATL